VIPTRRAYPLRYLVFLVPLLFAALLIIDAATNLHNTAPAVRPATATAAPGTSLAAAAQSLTVALDGSMPPIQTVGVTVQLGLIVRNTGRTIPHFAMLFTGLDHWALDSITSTWYQNPRVIGPDGGYDLGKLSHGEETLVTLTLVPEAPGAATLSLRCYANADDNLGIVDLTSHIGNGGDDQWKLTIKR
jgi:hypothetical protein